MGAIRVLLADDLWETRAGWRTALQAIGDIEVVGEAETAQEALGKVRESKPDVVLMDLRWFKDDSAGVSAIRQIKSYLPQTKIIAVTAYEHLIPVARRAGADMAIEKGFSREELARAIRATHGMEGSFPAEYVEPSPAMSEPLSLREAEVLERIAGGKTDKEIAHELSLSVSTIKNHARHIMGKLGVTKRAHAVRLAIERGLIRRT